MKKDYKQAESKTGIINLESQSSVPGSYLNVGLNVIRPSVNSMNASSADISRRSYNYTQRCYDLWSDKFNHHRIISAH